MLSGAVNFASLLNKGTSRHVRLGHPYIRALNLMFPDVSIENNDCEASILEKH